jgi:hypothetical protein
MAVVSGKAIDYGLDLKTSLNEINSSLIKIHSEDDYGVSSLMLKSVKDI